MISPFEKPVFKISVPPLGVKSVPICSKGIWDRLLMSAVSDSEKDIRKSAEALSDFPENVPVSLLKKFICDYRESVEAYCEMNKDIFMIPEKPDFENDDEKIRLPVITFCENIVAEYTGFDFDRINELDILDYRMLLADACKLKILRRADGEGKKYLNECYDYMHRNSNIFG
ncbi:MAG: hypothetical protein NC120_14035 [Ruminococcus sp.]|nr:hypothetical protein [Ruminococcus sp.]